MDALTLIPSQTALLVVDVQERVVPAMRPTPPASSQASTCCWRPHGSSTSRSSPRSSTPRGSGPRCSRCASASRPSTPPVHPAEKTVSSALAPAEVARGIASCGARSVIVTGVESHVCVFQTARELKRRGFHVHVPFDAVASRDPQCREAALALLARHGVSVAAAETVVFNLLGDAKSRFPRALEARSRAGLSALPSRRASRHDIGVSPSILDNRATSFPSRMSSEARPRDGSCVATSCAATR